MTTISEQITLSGKSLMAGKECTVNIFPSSENQIRFYVEGGKNPVIASQNSVISTDNCTVLGNGSEKVILVEHFMAACAFAGVNSIDVCLSSEELPIFDGSSAVWYEEFSKAGYNFSPEPKIEFSKPVYVSNGNSFASAIPSDSFKITYCVNFDHPHLKNKWVEFSFGENHEIISARTFGYLKDLEKFQKMGLALGASIENTLGLTDTGYTTDLRSDLEPAKHKILDLIGDLNLLSINPFELKANIIAKQAGHKLHVELAKQISQIL